MANQVDTMLEALGGAVRGIEPPEAFLRAVARRRIRRRVVGFAAFGVVLVLPALGYLMWPAAPRGESPTIAARRPAADSVLVLTRLNVGRDEVILPRLAAGIGGPPIRAGGRRDPEAVERLLGR